MSEGSKTKRKSICQEQRTPGGQKPSEDRDLVNSEQLEKVRDLKDGKLTGKKKKIRLWARRKFKLRGKR